MTQEFKTRLQVSPLETREVPTVVEENLQLEVEDESIRALEHAEGLILHLDKAYDCKSAAEAASIVLDYFGVESSLPRVARDKIQALMDAIYHDKGESVHAILKTTPFPEESYEAIFHMLLSSSRASEEKLLRDLFDREASQENVHEGYPYPDYYEPDYHIK